MSEIIILVGLMGAGKTTFAKEFVKNNNYEYIDFDFQYHKMIQKEHIINPKKDIPELLTYLSILLNHNQDKNFICDNWFKWSRDWWNDKEDNTLNKLRELIFHEINIIYLFTPLNICYKRYKEKNKEEYLIELDNFKETMELRQKNLLEKISKWAIQ